MIARGGALTPKTRTEHPQRNQFTQVQDEPEFLVCHRKEPEQPLFSPNHILLHSLADWRSLPAHGSRIPVSREILLQLGAGLCGTIAYVWIDHPLAQAVNYLLPARRIASTLPDLLGSFVVAISLLGLGATWIAYRHALTGLARLGPLLSFGAPLAFAVKLLAKWTFGRIAIRVYLYHPSFDGFHWFAGQGPFRGFPSGHMLVATTLVVLVVAVWPRLRALGVAVLLALAIALILTSYHFLADIIAGWALGHVLAWLMLAADARIRPGAAASTQP